MEQIVIAPVQWSRLKDIDDTTPINEGDFDCLHEVRDVLKRHGMLDRFGIALLHSHFDLGANEVWLEECDEENRVLITRPVHEAEAREGNVGTIWHLRDENFEVMGWCRKYCMRWMFGHSKEHNAHR